MKFPAPFSTRRILTAALLLTGGAALAQSASPLGIWPHPYLFYQLEGSPTGSTTASTLLPIETGAMLVGDRVKNGVETPLQGMFGYGFGYGLPAGLPKNAKILKATVQLREANSPMQVGDVNGLGTLYIQRNYWVNGQRAIATGAPDSTARAIALPFYGHPTIDVTEIVQGFVTRGEESCGFTLRFSNLTNKNNRTDNLSFRPGILTLTYSVPVVPTPTPKPSPTPIPTAKPTPQPSPTPTNTPVPTPTPAGPGKLQIVYGAAGASSIDLKIYDEATRTSRLLTSGGANTGSAFASWSPDKKQLVFSRVVGSARYDLFLINADGTGLRQLTNTPNFDELGARWSPDGTRLVYSYDAYVSNSAPVDPATGVYVMTLATGATQRVFAQPYPGRPDWSFDGTQILCGGYDASFQSGVFIVKPDGTFVRHVPIPDFVAAPRISPDGKQIAYGGIDTHVYDLTIDRFDPNSPDVGRFPDWSSDGQLLGEGPPIRIFDPKSKTTRGIEVTGAFPEAR